jgi:hypothetical protein
MNEDDPLTPDAIPPGPAPSAPPREVVGIFRTYQALQQAVDDLTRAGFARCALSMAGTQIGDQATEATVKLADDPLARRTDHFCTEALGDAEGALIGGFAFVPAFGTAMAAAAAGAGLAATAGLTIATGGTGALVGAALAILLKRRWDADHERQAEQGGLLLWVGIRAPEYEHKAIAILKRHAAEQVHSHELPE